MTLNCYSESEDRIKIFGTSCIAPGCDTPDQLWTRLLQNLPPNGVTIRTKDRFDSRFFGFSLEHSIKTDPQIRKLLECTYHAFNDVEVPESIINRSPGLHKNAPVYFIDTVLQSLGWLKCRTAVYVGSCGSDYQAFLTTGRQDSDSSSITGAENLGAQRALLAN